MTRCTIIEKNFSLRILTLITSPKLAKKATDMFHAGSIPTHYQLCAKGTASSDMMDIMGLGSIDKTMLLSIMPKSFSDEMLRKIKKELKLGVPGNGIAFTIPLSGANTLIFRMLQQLTDESFTSA